MCYFLNVLELGRYTFSIFSMHVIETSLTSQVVVHSTTSRHAHTVQIK